jgi:hypothetical protein
LGDRKINRWALLLLAIATIQQISEAIASISYPYLDRGDRAYKSLLLKYRREQMKKGGQG